MVTAMLLLNTLPAFAEETNIIPTGGVWETSEGKFNDLQSACNASFDYFYTKPEADADALLKKLSPPETVFDGSCYPFSRLEKPSYEGTEFEGYGYCTVKFKNRIRWPFLPDGTIGSQYFCSDFIYFDNIKIRHYPATCPAPVNGQRAAADCTQTVSLTPAPGQAEPRPKGSEGDGKSTYDLIAKVTEGNQPKAGMALTFKVAVEAGSGGIPTTPTGRPTGNLSVTSGTTNASGEVKLTFTSPIFAGTHKVTVTCAKCTGTVKEDTETFNVKVPNLILLPADSRWKFISNDNYHKNNNASAATRTVYYVTEQAKTNLEQMVDALQTTPLDSTGSRFWGVIGLNDASLKWGGKFNAYVKVNGVYPPYPWNRQGQHGEHRLGVQIDLQTLYRTKEDSFVMYNRVCNPKADQYKVIPTILFHTGGSYHLHAYLLGNIAVKLGGGNCRTMND